MVRACTLAGPALSAEHFSPGDFPRFAGLFSRPPCEGKDEKREKKKQGNKKGVEGSSSRSLEREKGKNPFSWVRINFGRRFPPSLLLRPAHRRGPSDCAPYRFVQLWERRREAREGLLKLSLVAAGREKVEGSERVSFFLSFFLGGCSSVRGACSFEKRNQKKASDRGACNYFSSFSILFARDSPALAGERGEEFKVTNEYVKWIQFVTGKKTW